MRYVPAFREEIARLQEQATYLPVTLFRRSFKKCDKQLSGLVQVLESSRLVGKRVSLLLDDSSLGIISVACLWPRAKLDLVLL